MNGKLTAFIIFLFLTLMIWIPMAIKLPSLPVIFGAWILAHFFGLISLVFLSLYLKDLIKRNASTS